MSVYRKTTFQVEVLSQDQDISDWDIEQAVEQMTYGDFSGVSRVVSVQELTAREVVAALKEQGADPEFFGLDEEGNALP